MTICMFILSSISLSRLDANQDSQDFWIDNVQRDNRVWQAGGSAEMASKGKCWIDGECVAGPAWWIGSHDDSESAYRLKHHGKVKSLDQFAVSCPSHFPNPFSVAIERDLLVSTRQLASAERIKYTPNVETMTQIVSWSHLCHLETMFSIRP